MDLVTGIVLFVGLCSCTLAIGLGIRFATSGWAVGMALAMEKGVDAIASAATVVFNTNAVATGSNEIDMYLASGLRLAIFVPSIVASLHLFNKMQQLSREQNNAVIGNHFREQYEGLTQTQLLNEMDSALAVLQSKRKKRNRNG